MRFSITKQIGAKWDDPFEILTVVQEYDFCGVFLTEDCCKQILPEILESWMAPWKTHKEDIKIWMPLKGK